MTGRVLQIARKGASGVELSPRQPKYKKRVGKLGEVFWE
jgi:hypothetical protein